MSTLMFGVQLVLSFQCCVKWCFRVKFGKASFCFFFWSKTTTNPPPNNPLSTPMINPLLIPITTGHLPSFAIVGFVAKKFRLQNRTHLQFSKRTKFAIFNGICPMYNGHNDLEIGQTNRVALDAH